MCRCVLPATTRPSTDAPNRLRNGAAAALDVQSSEKQRGARDHACTTGYAQASCRAAGIYPHTPQIVVPHVAAAQVLEGLETYIATEQFLHKLEAASAEWIDLSEHQLPHPHPTGWPHDAPSSSTTDPKQQLLAPQQQQPAKAGAAPAGASPPAPAQRTSSGGGFFGLWRRSQPPAPSTPSTATSADGIELPGTTPPSNTSGRQQQQASSSSDTAAAAAEDSAQPSGGSAQQGADAASAGVPPVVVAASCFELVGPQPPLAGSALLQQEPFVLVSQDDAVEAMAYYIALYLSRAPEARNMEPRQLQAALKQTFMVWMMRAARVG